MSDKPMTSVISALPIAGKPKMPPRLPYGTKVAICGINKSGKSTMAATAGDSPEDRRPLTLDFERRLFEVDVPRMSPLYISRGVDVSTLSYPFNTILANVSKGKKFQFLIDWYNAVYDAIKADAGTSVGTLIHDTIDTYVALCESAYFEDGTGISNDNRQNYQRIYKKLMPIIEKFTDRMGPVDQVFCCHVAEFQDAEGKQKIGLSMPPKVREWIGSHVDLIGLIYTPQDSGVNRFWTANRPGWPTGSGLSRVPSSIPTTMQAIYACYRGEDPELYQPVIAQVTSNDEPVEEAQEAA